MSRVKDHRRRHADEAVRITSAAESRDVDISSRQRRYVISMSIRLVAFVGAVLAGVNGLHWLWPILMLAALVLPYVAVVMANTADTRGDTFELDDSPFGRPQLPPGDRGREL